MPWHKVKGHSSCPSNRPWAVVKDSDGSVTGCHSSESSADAQLAALYAGETNKAVVRLGPTMDLCLDCGEFKSTDGVLGCACDGMMMLKAHDLPGENGVMLALYPSEGAARQLAEHDANGESLPWEDMHVTLAYLGRASEINPSTLERLLAALPRFAATHSLVVATGGGVGEFPENEDHVVPVWIPVSAYELDVFRRDLIDLLDTIAVPYATQNGWVPHMTLGYYTPPIPAVPARPSVDLLFDAVTLSIGGRRINYVLEGGADPTGVVFKVEGDGLELHVEMPDIEPDATFGVYAPAAGTLRKDADQRFTFGPMYVPDTEDAHGEFSTAEDLQQAVWNYVRAADRRIRLQHNREVVAGELVECAVWPYETEVELSLPQDDGSVKMEKVTLPANTPFLGVVWEPPAWELVKRGLLRGYSIGGRARRVYADLPE